MHDTRAQKSILNLEEQLVISATNRPLAGVDLLFDRFDIRPFFTTGLRNHCLLGFSVQIVDPICGHLFYPGTSGVKLGPLL